MLKYLKPSTYRRSARLGRQLADAGFQLSLRRCPNCSKHSVLVKGDESWCPLCHYGSLRPETKAQHPEIWSGATIPFKPRGG